MKKTNIIRLLILTIGLSWSDFAQAQQSSNSAGGDATGNGGSVAYSVGQIVYTTHTGSTGSLAQGVQQAYVISSIGINETELNSSLSLFPNPIVDNLTLQISDFNKEKLSYLLFDTEGKLLTNGQVIAKQTQINTASLPPATYFIKVLNQENKQVESFKIIKN
jgi:hypothetical protein